MFQKRWDYYLVIVLKNGKFIRFSEPWSSADDKAKFDGNKYSHVRYEKKFKYLAKILNTRYLPPLRKQKIIKFDTNQLHTGNPFIYQPEKKLFQVYIIKRIVLSIFIAVLLLLLYALDIIDLDAL